MPIYAADLLVDVDRTGSKWAGLRLVLLLAIVATAARASSFGNPIVQVDEQFYLLVARSMVNGAIPYVDIWDRKPIALFLTYLPPALLPPAAGVWAYQAMAWACVIATALLIVRIARQAGWGRGAVIAACFYILWLNLADGQGGQSPVFYNLPVAAAIALVGGERADVGIKRSVVAMLLLGLAIQMKYTVVFEGIWIGLWLAWRAFRRRPSPVRTASYAALMALTALVPTVTALLVYAALGHADAYIFSNFVSIFWRHPDAAADQLDNALTAIALLSPFVAMAAMGSGPPYATPGQRQTRSFLRGWFVTALVGFAAFGGWYNHYALPVMLPGAVCSAGFLSHRRTKPLFVAVGALALFALGQRIVAADVARRGTRAQFAAIVTAIGLGPGSLYVDWGEPALYTFSGRHALSRYVFPTHLQLAREAGAIGIDQGAELARILARMPDVVVMMGPSTATREDPGSFARVAAFVRKRRYEASPPLPLGRLWVRVYHRPR